jgi:pyruvate kinase
MLDKKLMKALLHEIQEIRPKLYIAREQVSNGHARYKSLLNLKQYLILRSQDRTELQEKLFLMSLSSLGRSYAHVAASIDTLYDQISSSLHLNEITKRDMSTFHHLSIAEAILLASQNNTLLFGGKISPKLSEQTTSIMLTLPTHAIDNDGALIYELVQRGVQIFRINTAHDSLPVWKAMAEIIIKINQDRDEENKVKIFVDLAGPKIRTQSIQRVNFPVAIGSNKRQKEVHIFADKTTKTQPERVNERTQLKELACLNIEKSFYKKMKLERPMRIIDSNAKQAYITITELNDSYAVGTIDKKIYIDSSARIHSKKHTSALLNIEDQVEEIRLFQGDFLEITEADVLGHAAIKDEDENKPARIGCSFSGIVAHVKIGDKVFIDDGKIGLVVTQKNNQSILCKVTNAKASGVVLKEEKGINFPDTYIQTKALTQTDYENLLGVLAFVDHVSISFCQSAQDIADIQNFLRQNGREDIGIIAKIETKQAIANMPAILEELLLWEKSAVMIARGDLAIEVGFANMAHIQESLLDICDAAHMPVIWATQVLENQMKNNLPSRAEVTDAAMAGRAECIMLNKGAFASDTIDILTHILNDMHSLFKKNRQLLKKETLW